MICTLLKSTSSKERKLFLKTIEVYLSNQSSNRRLGRGGWCNRIHSLPLPSGAASALWMHKIAQRDRQLGQSVGATRKLSYEATNTDRVASRSGINEQEQVNEMAFDAACKGDIDGAQASKEEQSKNANTRDGVKNWRRFLYMIDAVGTILAMTASSGNTDTQQGIHVSGTS